MRHLYAFCILLAVLTSPAGAATLATRLDELSRPLLEQGWLKSACVGVTIDGHQQVFAFGQVRPGGPAPDADTVYEIGSITKTMTAVLTSDAILRGEARLEDTVAALLPGTQLPSYQGRAITVLDLLTHTSGLPTIPSDFAEGADPANPYATYGADRMLVSLAAYTLTRAPGSAYEYSNQGFALLGHTLAQRTGQSWERLLAQRLLGPLGMSDSGLALSPAQAARFAPGHNVDGEPQSPWEFLVYDACGAVRSTVRDMLRFVQAQIEPPEGPLGRAIAATHAPRAPANMAGEQVALGWLVETATGTVWHNGQTGGYHSYAAFQKDRRRGVVVLASSATDDAERLGLGALAYLAGQFYEPPALPVDLPFDATALAELAGRYRTRDGSMLTVRPEAEHLRMVFEGGGSARLHQRAPDHLYLRVAQVWFTVCREAGRVTGLTLHYHGPAGVVSVDAARLDEGAGE